MDNGNVMGRRKFFSRFFPVLTETIVEKTKDETKISTNTSVIRQTPTLDKIEVVEGAQEDVGRKYPWVGM
ncbi:hypothetical protein [Candidatus Nitrotoga sp. AM1P]|uniref:hypothetical protein n=1 Tax=Candidatus Nitrotoga sp. AM1P TaxID=2559597 RepID=UPI0010B39A84|nr:hypothetical protein [Candidatus Nitrotoga sp. AM1P]BBJ23364.1 hypothetical protein W01_12910 [Candidatus Nitrotoga sp. AM1P]BBJ23756.1 hypothetical protein W01_16830 [Candidatus Nitrotoga sp. AM1P]